MLAINAVHQGDCLQLLRQLDDATVDCVVTSPPYWRLRDYGVAGQLGLEGTPDEYIAHLTEVFEEVRRALKPTGTLWLNLGDCYATGTPAADRAPREHGAIALKHKDLVGLPWRVAFALQKAGWYLGSDVVWSKPNPCPESVLDRPTRSHEFLFMLAKSCRYFYDADAVREPAVGKSDGPRDFRRRERLKFRDPHGNPRGSTKRWQPRPYRRRRTVWTIASQPYHGPHFAAFPGALVEPCVKAGCPSGGLVLDPFGGTGTVGEVAGRLGRQWMLFELNPEYVNLARARIAAAGD